MIKKLKNAEEIAIPFFRAMCVRHTAAAYTITYHTILRFKKFYSIHDIRTYVHSRQNFDMPDSALHIPKQSYGKPVNYFNC